MIKFFVFISLLFFGFQSYANSLRHDASPSELEYARKVNRELRFFKSYAEANNAPSYEPVEDDAEFAYVLLAAANNFDSEEILDLRRLIASNLPENTKLVVLTTTAEAKGIRKRYSAWISPDRLILATDSSPFNGNGFWARDAFPIPVKDKNTREISLIAHQYFRPFYSFDSIARSVSAEFVERREIFVGGNLIADRKGNCFVVDSVRLYDMSPDEIQNIYGCKTMNLFRHISGIGDVDEVLKPIGDNIMLTNQPEYEPILRRLGYNVVFLPQLRGTYRTHVNSLVVEKTVFMPVFGIYEDLEAQKIYERLGYKVVPIKSNVLSDFLHGSIHCQTMAYPAIAQENLFKNLGLQAIPEQE